MNFHIPDYVNFKKCCVERYGSIENLITKAKNGDVLAQGDLGLAYSEDCDDLLPKDTDKAIGWLNTAVENGCEHPVFLGKLGELLDRKETPQHRRKAYEMYHRAAKLGCSSSQFNLAEMYRCGVDDVVNEDLCEAFKWYKKAAGEDQADELDLGVLDRLRFGTIKKLANAAVGFTEQKAALQSLFKYYLEGDCPEGRPQPTKAVYYLTRAAELGDAEAQRNLGEIYLSGNCDQIKDVAKARRWFEKASANGDVRAKKLLEQCKENAGTQPAASEPSVEAITQSFSIMKEKLQQKCDANVHPFVISQPVAFSEEMFNEFQWSQTARIYCQAFKLVKEGFEVLCNSNFSDDKGISLIAQGYLTENSILQSFPQIQVLAPQIFKLCEKSLQNNPCFFESLVLSFAFMGYEKKLSHETIKTDGRKIMCLKNLIHFIQKAELNHVPSKHSFKFDENYSSWLHVLYDHLGGIHVVAEAFELAAEAFENSLRCCPSYFPAKRGLGYCLMELYSSRVTSQEEASVDSQGTSTHLEPDQQNRQNTKDREISKYSSWTKEQLADMAERMMNEFLAEAPLCWKTYPNVCYYLANLASINKNMSEFKKNYELGQDAEGKRLPFFNPVNLPLKDLMSPLYQLFSSLPEPVKCGNKVCTKKVKESELKSCAGCGKQKYCSKDCQKADWKNHKATCSVSKKHKGKGNA